MKSNRILSFCGILFSTFFFNIENVHTQITIQSNEFPSAIGTYIITEYDMVDTVQVDVGLPGENQIWKLDFSYPSEFARQLIIEKNTAPFHSDFPEVNMVTRYTGKMGQLIHSYFLMIPRGLCILIKRKRRTAFQFWESVSIRQL